MVSAGCMHLEQLSKHRWIFVFTFDLFRLQQFTLSLAGTMSHHFRGVQHYADKLMDYADGRAVFRGRGQRPSNKDVLKQMSAIDKCRQRSYPSNREGEGLFLWLAHEGRRQEEIANSSCCWTIDDRRRLHFDLPVLCPTLDCAFRISQSLFFSIYFVFLLGKKKQQKKNRNTTIRVIRMWQCTSGVSLGDVGDRWSEISGCFFPLLLPSFFSPLFPPPSERFAPALAQLGER